VELKQIKELMAAMERAGLKKISIKEKDGSELMLERAEELTGHTQHQAPVYHPHPPVYHPPSPVIKPQHHEPEKIVEGRFVTSPMVGTFYSSPSPDDPVFVKVGDRVEENTVVCIIEAMKVMNEVKAGVSGIIAEICINNGHPVEFGTKIFRVT